MPESYIGLMSGTSIDAIDTVLVDFTKDSMELKGSLSYPINNHTKDRLHRLCRSGKQASLDEFSQLDVCMGRLFADAVNQLLNHCGENAAQITAIGSHGQTIYHNPEGNTPTSIQIGDPNIIAEQTGITTVADFRRRDIAAGGQGAPLVPAFHQAIFQHPGEQRAVVNIGGIANVTLLPGSPDKPVRGFDTGPGNTLLDQWAMRHLGQSIDRDGDFARQGNSNPALLEKLLADPYFSRSIPKSTGREYFNLDWLEAIIGETPISPEDVQASLCELSAHTIINAISMHAPETHKVIVCGGGTHNPVLMALLRQHATKFTIDSSAAYNIDPDYVEGMAFAWLARQTLLRQYGNISSVTGAHSNCILGGIYPGNVHSNI
jgi:anhydro-N-acetylmuramic acid kinase